MKFGEAYHTRHKVKQAGGKVPAIPPDPPRETAHLWAAFLDLANSRSNGMQSNPISYSDIHSYNELMELKLRPWEIQAIRAVDATILALAYPPPPEATPKSHADVIEALKAMRDK